MLFGVSNAPSTFMSHDPFLLPFLGNFLLFTLMTFSSLAELRKSIFCSSLDSGYRDSLQGEVICQFEEVCILTSICL